MTFNADASRARNSYLGELIKAALIDNHDALVRARRAVKAAGDPPELLEKLETLPTYEPATLEAGDIVMGHPIVLTEADQTILGEEFNPPKNDPRGSQIELIDNALKDYWRGAFAGRFAEVERLAAHGGPR